jgi:hypothetical protein
LVDLLSEEERRLTTSRWAVKTAFVAARLIKSEELDPSWPRMLCSNQDLLPSGFSVFSAWHEGSALAGISLNHRSRWTEYPLDQPCEVPTCVSGRWFKLAFRLNQLMILVVCVPSDHVRTVSVPGLHHTIWPSYRPKFEHWYRGFEVAHLDSEDALTIFSDSLSVLHSSHERTTTYLLK